MGLRSNGIVYTIGFCLFGGAACEPTSYAAEHTIELQFNENSIHDSGFEGEFSNDLAATTSRWFRAGESNEAGIQFTGAHTLSGSQSVVFGDYTNNGSIAQNVDLQIDPTKHYHLSFWIRVDDSSEDDAHTSESSLQAALYSAPEKGGPYIHRVDLLENATVPAGAGWERMEATVSGTDLDSHDGEYLQLRLSKVNENSSHKIYIDNVSLIEKETAKAPHPISRLVVGGNLVYDHEPESTWEDGTKIELMKHLGMSNLRYPEGGQTRFWDWEFPYHDHPYRNFWDPAYEATLTEQRKAELKEQNGYRLSLDRFLEICEETGAVPLIGINMTQGWKYDRLQDSVDKAVRLVQLRKRQNRRPSLLLSVQRSRQ
ncbi:hypothetical protein [Pelagicoccus mobilis]|uniref:CBM-cenC domain-containing protein n=1 Tax=Pelagicoccus mobilis TaxID=415221 RepID=A0A934S1G0_9BACT|nr:hypothetical protein [Pelagicoccus mobilis]MBK1877689.1 hypothetical protein [Pelagicoccus mobilis]